VTVTLAALTTTLHTLFTTTASLLGRTSGLIRRQRHLTAADFAQTLVFGWIDQPKASLESFAVRLNLSPQALQQRMNPHARAFFTALIIQALRRVHAARPCRDGLLKRFSAVVVEDTTIVNLPADCSADWRGTGGSDLLRGRAAMKVHIRWELTSGQLLSLQCWPQVMGDAKLAATATELPVGALHLADQGFFDTHRWCDFANRFWISRVPSGMRLKIDVGWRGLADWLSGLREPQFDAPVGLVPAHGLVCRLVVRRCPAAVAARRRAKLRAYFLDKRGREPSRRQLVLCDWLVLATNVPAERLNAMELWAVYRCRWQVELLFKRCKSRLGWSDSQGRRGERVVVEVLAKVLGLIVVLWSTLLGSGPLAGKSPWKQFGVVRGFALRLQDVVGSRTELTDLLSRLEQELDRIKPQPRRKQPTTRQLLINPTLAA
jgi:hypothetical protein